MLLGQQCCDTLLLNVAIVWPEHVNAAGSTMLGYVALKYCKH